MEVIHSWCAVKQAEIWRQALKPLRVRSKEASLVLTEPPMNLPNIQEITDQARYDVDDEWCSGCRP